MERAISGNHPRAERTPRRYVGVHLEGGCAIVATIERTGLSHPEQDPMTWSFRGQTRFQARSVQRLPLESGELHDILHRHAAEGARLTFSSEFKPEGFRSATTVAVPGPFRHGLRSDLLVGLKSRRLLASAPMRQIVQHAESIEAIALGLAWWGANVSEQPARAA